MRVVGMSGVRPWLRLQVCLGQVGVHGWLLKVVWIRWALLMVLARSGTLIDGDAVVLDFWWRPAKAVLICLFRQWARERCISVERLRSAAEAGMKCEWSNLGMNGTLKAVQNIRGLTLWRHDTRHNIKTCEA